MTGKTVVVTGGTRGIGKEIARGLARRDADVVLLGRDVKRGDAAAAELGREGRGDIAFLPVDLSSLGEVRRIARELASGFDRIDVLINNAAVVRPERCLTIDRHEETLAVGHLAPFLLTEHLLPTLQRSAPARIVNVSSGVVRRADLTLDDIQLEGAYSALDGYGRAKLLNLVWTFELARRVENVGVSVFAVDPGVANTGTHRDYPRPAAVEAMMRAVWLVLGRRFTTERAAQSAIRAACAPDLEGRTGLFLDSHGRPIQPPDVAIRNDAQRDVVQVSQALIRHALGAGAPGAPGRREQGAQHDCAGLATGAGSNER